MAPIVPVTGYLGLVELSCRGPIQTLGGLQGL